MPYADPDPTDPMTLNGVMFETEGRAALCEMAEAFIEEYCRLGFSPQRIMKLFQTRGYAGPYLAYRFLGEAEIERLIGEYTDRWGPRLPGLSRATGGSGDIALPVLEE